MPNATVAFGLRPVKEPDPSSIITCVALASYATDIFIGDTVIPSGTGDATTGYMSVIRGTAAANNSVGVVVGVEPMSPDVLTRKYGLASTLRFIKVVPALNTTIFEIMANTAIDVDALGNGCDLTIGAGSTVTGFSGIAADTGALATTNKMLRLVGFANRPDNQFGASGTTFTGIKVYVIFAKSLWLAGDGA